MIDYSTVNIEKLIIHKVGNKQKEIENELSNNIISTGGDLGTHLINFFLTPFSKHGEVYKFTHHTGLDMNELYSCSKKLFSDVSLFNEISVKIIDHLYEQSEHPHIKAGEVLIAYMSDIIFDDQITDAFCIFKIERKQNYFKLSEHSKKIDINVETGISTKKFDKGCLIINLEPNEGFRVLSIDNNNYDSEYWLNKFQNVTYLKDYHYHTSNYVDFCKSFSEEVIEKDKGKDEQIAFLNKSMNYLSKREDFDINEFADEVLEEPVIRKEFFDYKKVYEEQLDREVTGSFPIAQNTVKAKKRLIKNLIMLDTDIHIKFNSSDIERTRQYVERGYDKERGMSYYKVFYYSEIK